MFLWYLLNAGGLSRWLLIDNFSFCKDKQYHAINFRRILTTILLLITGRFQDKNSIARDVSVKKYKYTHIIFTHFYKVYFAKVSSNKVRINFAKFLKSHI